MLNNITSAQQDTSVSGHSPVGPHATRAPSATEVGPASAPQGSALDCFHEADHQNRAVFGTSDAKGAAGLPAPRGMRPRDADVPKRWVAVFAGASKSAPEYMEAAQSLGAHLAAEGWGVLYGGRQVGLMGALASAALAGGGWVVGISAGKGARMLDRLSRAR